MAQLTVKPKVELKVVFEVDEEEARALDALAGYGDDQFVQHFYEHLGRAYMEKHEQGLRKFLASIRKMMPAIIESTNRSRAAFQGVK